MPNTFPSGTFSFCGTDIRTLGLEYAPDISETFVYKPATTESQVESFEGHNGGYYYGSWTTPKDFVLRCFFEEKNIDKGLMAKIYSLFKVGKSGKLVFSRRPWCYYNATITEPIQTEFTNYLNGLITITMKAMYPFARSDIMTNIRTEKYHNMMMANTAVFDKPGMELPNEHHFTEKDSIKLVNPGTERAALGFYISGDVGDGIIIENAETNQKCKMVAITNEITDYANKAVFVDPINGKTLLVSEYGTELAFKYHEYGFLELEPSFPALRDVYIEFVNKTTVKVFNKLETDVVGRYIFIDGNWYEIIWQPNKHTIMIDGEIKEKKYDKTMIISMNHITVSPITNMDVQIKFVFKPTYS